MAASVLHLVFSHMEPKHKCLACIAVMAKHSCIPSDDTCPGDEAAELNHDQHVLPLAGQQASLGQEEWPHQGHLQFCGVSLRYGRGLPDALDGVSFELRPGQKVGICGRTGQSTLHLYPHSKEHTGMLMIDGYAGAVLPLRVLGSN